MPPLTPDQIRAKITELEQARSQFQEAKLAALTVTGYAYDWAMFTAWCAAMGRRSLPATPETVAYYLTSLLVEGKKVTTARRRVCAIVHHHRSQNCPSPASEDIYELLNAAQRLRRERPRQMRPLLVSQLRSISRLLREEGTKRAMRDRALLVLGFASALRRSSIAALSMRDIEFASEGVVITLYYEKNDQQGKGRRIGLPGGRQRHTCPVRCLQDWLKLRGSGDGPLFPRLDRRHAGGFMDGECVERILKRSVAKIGLDPCDRYGAHSLRAGFVTAAGEGGANELSIALQTGHRSLQTLRRYFRPHAVFRGNACAAAGL